MNELYVGIIIGIFIYSTFVAFTAALTENEETVIVCAIGVWWFFYGINILLKEHIMPEIKRIKRKRMIDKRRRIYEKSCRI